MSSPNTFCTPGLTKEQQGPLPATPSATAESKGGGFRRRGSKSQAEMMQMHGPVPHLPTLPTPGRAPPQPSTLPRRPFPSAVPAPVRGWAGREGN